jgi:hypothetical protein
VIQVDHYGLHFDGAIPWLVQGRGGSNFVGLAKQSPFVIKGGGMCNHLIPLAAPVPDRVHWEFFQKIATDPLVNAMLPIPREPHERAYFFEDPYDDLNLYISCLSRLSSPIRSVLKPAWMIKPSEVTFQMERTNIQPWIITQATPREQETISRIAKASSYLPRTAIVTGKPEVVATPPMRRSETKIRDINLETLVSQPLENIGAMVLRRFSRKEDILGDIESRQDRRDRMIKERNPKED